MSEGSRPSSDASPKIQSLSSKDSRPSDFVQNNDQNSRSTVISGDMHLARVVELPQMTVQQEEEVEDPLKALDDMLTMESIVAAMSSRGLAPWLQRARDLLDRIRDPQRALERMSEQMGGSSSALLVRKGAFGASEAETSGGEEDVRVGGVVQWFVPSRESAGDVRSTALEGNLVSRTDSGHMRADSMILPDPSGSEGGSDIEDEEGSADEDLVGLASEAAAIAAIETPRKVEAFPAGDAFTMSYSQIGVNEAGGGESRMVVVHQREEEKSASVEKRSTKKHPRKPPKSLLSPIPKSSKPTSSHSPYERKLHTMPDKTRNLILQRLHQRRSSAQKTSPLSSSAPSLHDVKPRVDAGKRLRRAPFSAHPKHLPRRLPNPNEEGVLEKTRESMDREVKGAVRKSVQDWDALPDQIALQDTVTSTSSTSPHQKRQSSNATISETRKVVAGLNHSSGAGATLRVADAIDTLRHSDRKSTTYSAIDEALTSYNRAFEPHAWRSSRPRISPKKITHAFQNMQLEQDVPEPDPKDIQLAPPPPPNKPGM